MLLGRGDGGASSEASDGCCCIRTGVPQTSAGTPQLKQLLEDTWDQKGNPVYRPFGAGSIHNEGAGKMGPAGSALLVLSTRFHALKLLPPACHHVPLKGLVPSCQPDLQPPDTGSLGMTLQH
nr:uncharacterized protein LOC110364592 isoform X3 [Columba livia]